MRARQWIGAIFVLGLFLAASAAVAGEPSYIVVWKSQRQLWVLRNGSVVRRYPVSLGRVPIGPKRERGDLRTPVGRYFVYEKRTKTKFHRFLAINYPELSDAEVALQQGRISADTWADVWFASKRRVKPPWDTPLGGFVGIHGTGAVGRKARMRLLHDWTEGCIALTDRHIEELYELTPVGTAVDIYE